MKNISVFRVNWNPGEKSFAQIFLYIGKTSVFYQKCQFSNGHKTILYWPKILYLGVTFNEESKLKPTFSWDRLEILLLANWLWEYSQRKLLTVQKSMEKISECVAKQVWQTILLMKNLIW